MSRYFESASAEWSTAETDAGDLLQRSPVWADKYGVRTTLIKAPRGLTLPEHTHQFWVQVMVLEGRMKILEVNGSSHFVSAGDCYFAEPGDTHTEIAVEDVRILITERTGKPAS